MDEKQGWNVLTKIPIEWLLVVLIGSKEYLQPKHHHQVGLEKCAGVVAKADRGEIKLRMLQVTNWKPRDRERKSSYKMEIYSSWS